MTIPNNNKNNNNNYKNDDDSNLTHFFTSSLDVFQVAMRKGALEMTGSNGAKATALSEPPSLCHEFERGLSQGGAAAEEEEEEEKEERWRR